MALRMLLFAVFATTMMALLLGYVGVRSSSYLPERLRTPFYGFLGLYWIGTIAVFATMKIDTGSRWLYSLNWGVYLFMGFVSIVIAGILLQDIGSLLLHAFDRIRSHFGHHHPTASDLDVERRRMIGGIFTAGVWAVAGGVSALGSREARRLADVVEIDVPIDNLDPKLNGFRIVQLSDIHIGPTIKGDYLRGIVDRVNTLAADLVAITGDVVDGSVTGLAADVAPLADLQARHGTWLVTGNHEYYSGVEAWVTAFRNLGIQVLLNEHQTIDHDGAPFVVAGITDYSAERLLPSHKSDPAAAIAGAPEDVFRLLLAHQPKSARVAHAAAHFDLQLSGHTHGGQYFPWNLVVHLAQPFVAGLNQLGRMWIYTSRGTGYWGPPIRMGAPAEITLLSLVQGTPSESVEG